MSKTELLDFTKEELVDIIYKSMCDKDNLIKYLEDKINQLKKCQNKAIELKQINAISDFNLRIASYQDILERVKSGKYE